MLIGYARVSTADQNLDLQKDALAAAGCERVFTDTASGARAERPGLSDALCHCRKGDTLIVWKLDRLGRSLPHLVDTVRNLVEQGVGFKSLQESIDTTTSGGKLIFHIFASLAEFERDVIRERTNAGLSAARARGRKGGRPRGVADEKKQKAALALKANPKYSVGEICAIVGISRNTYYKYTRSEEKSPAQQTTKRISVSEPLVPERKVMRVELRLRIENTSKAERGKGKTRKEIERQVLESYLVSPRPREGGPYELAIPYTTEEELDRTIREIMAEAARIAETRQCLLESECFSLQYPDRRW